MAAMCKLYASDIANVVTRECVQLLGGYGYSREYPLERMMCDSKITEIYAGYLRGDEDGNRRFYEDTLRKCIMKIIVCIKQVPDTSEVQIDPETNTLIRTGIPTIINPDDRTGIEAALELRDGAEAGSTVTVVSMGPPRPKWLCEKRSQWVATRLI